MSSTSLLPDQSSAHVSLGHIPTWWEGESLYGWCSRVHTLEGCATKALGAILFGRNHACRNVDVPVGMDRFVAATAGRLGGVEDILRNRTVLAAYWPFADALTRENVVDAVTDVTGASAAQMLGLTASRLGANHPLRSCPDCRREQKKEKGLATWMVEQQLPGVWWCPSHHRPLEQVRDSRAVWSKPGETDIELGRPATQVEALAMERMTALAHRIPFIEHANSECLASSCIRRLRSLGLAISSARLNTSKVRDWVESRPLMSWIRKQGDAVLFPHGDWVVRMLRGRSREHPLKWMVLWTCLWSEEPLERSLRAFDEAANGQVAIEWGDQHLLWPDEGKLVRVALPEPVEEAFNGNQTVQGVMETLGVSLRAVRLWMQEHPEFALAWGRRVHLQRLAVAKARMNAAIDADPTMSRSSLLVNCRQEVAWLRTHAPTTLRRVLDRLPSTRVPQRDLFAD